MLFHWLFYYAGYVIFLLILKHAVLIAIRIALIVK